MPAPLDYEPAGPREEGKPKPDLTFTDLLHVALNVYIGVVGVGIILVVIFIALAGLFGKR